MKFRKGKTTAILVSLLLVICTADAQPNKIDTTRLVTWCKMNLIKFDEASWPPAFLKGFIDYKPVYRFVQSTGFDTSRFSFLEISCQRYEDSTNRIVSDDRRTGLYPVYFGECNGKSFVFGYDRFTEKIYRLSGFETDDFIPLYNNLWKARDLYDLPTNKLRRKENFKTYFTIEGVDLGGLYDKNRRYLRE